MLHQIWNISNGNTRVEIQNNVSKLLFTVQYNVNTPLIYALGNDFYHRNAMINGFIRAMAGKITVTRYSRALGTKQLITNMVMADLAEICANNEGFIKIENPSPKTAKLCTAHFSVELSNVGAIPAGKDDYIAVELEGFANYLDPVDGTSNDATVKIHSIGSFVTVSEHIKYSPIALNTNQQLKFGCESHYAFATTSSNEKIYFYGATGQTWELRPDELEHIACDVSDGVYLVNDGMVPYNRWRVIPIQLATECIAQAQAANTIYLMSNKNFEKEKDVVDAAAAAHLANSAAAEAIKK